MTLRYWEHEIAGLPSELKISHVVRVYVSCLIVAPDLESDTTEGGLDDRVREVLGMSYEKSIPVIFALSRIRLGQDGARIKLYEMRETISLKRQPEFTFLDSI